MTLEKRAKESQRHHFDESRETFNKEHDNFREWCFGYCQGATEQQAIDEAETDKKIEEAKANQLDKDITAAYHWAIARLGGTSQERQDMANDLMRAIVRDFDINKLKSLSYDN